MQVTSQSQNHSACSKKNCMSYCSHLAPDQAYAVLKNFYGQGFAQWFVDRMPKETVDHSFSIAA